MKESLRANTPISHYRVIPRLGAGGMGEVYLAEDILLDRRTAETVLFVALIAYSVFVGLAYRYAYFDWDPHPNAAHSAAHSVFPCRDSTH